MSGSWSDEVFGRRPLRPDHPDFWRMSEIVLANDGRIEAARGQREKDVAWEEITGAVVDLRSVTYVATQRVMRMLGQPNTAVEAGLQAKIAAVWIDAFVTGAMFEQRGGHHAGSAEG